MGAPIVANFRMHPNQMQGLADLRGAGIFDP
jgi:hypothetical protein